MSERRHRLLPQPLFGGGPVVNQLVDLRGSRGESPVKVSTGRSGVERGRAARDSALERGFRCSKRRTPPFEPPWRYGRSPLSEPVSVVQNRLSGSCSGKPPSGRRPVDAVAGANLARPLRELIQGRGRVLEKKADPSRLVREYLRRPLPSTPGARRAGARTRDFRLGRGSNTPPTVGGTG